MGKKLAQFSFFFLFSVSFLLQYLTLGPGFKPTGTFVGGCQAMEDRGEKWGIGKMFFECVMSCESVLCVMIKEKKEKDKNCFRFFFLEILEQPIGTCNLLLFLYFFGG